MSHDRPIEHVVGRLSDYLDGKDVAPDEVERHLDECESCRSHLNQLESIVEALGDLPAPDVPDTFTAGVMEQINHEAHSTGFARFVLWRVLLPLAAAVLILVGGALLFSLNAGFQSADSIATISAVNSEEVLLAELVNRIETNRKDVPEWLYALGSEEEDDQQEVLTAEEWLDTLGETDWFREMLNDWQTSSAGDYDQPEVFEDVDLLDNVESDVDDDEVWL